MVSLHFNRTNIIGVPGHPNGYDDTFNMISITENVILKRLQECFQLPTTKLQI